MSIPKVKEWRITMAIDPQPEGCVNVADHSRVYRVLAPTRKLAVMNLRSEGIYGAVCSVGVYRKQVGQTELVAWDLQAAREARTAPTRP